MIERNGRFPGAELLGLVPKRILESVLFSKDPVASLEQVGDNLPYFLEYSEAVGLKERINRGSDSEESLAKLLVWCSPQMTAIVKRVQGLGMDDWELVKETLLVTRDIIVGWEPVLEGKPKVKDNLRFQVSNCGGRKIEQRITGLYGLGVRYFPAVKLYFDAAEEFFLCSERPPEEEDLRAMRAIVEEMCQALRAKGKPVPRLTKKQKKNAPWRGDVTVLIHAIYTGAAVDCLERGVDLLGRRACEDEVLINIVGEKLEEAISLLRPRRGGQILKHLYGFDEVGQHTMQETADHFGVTRGRIQQIRAKALKKLRCHGIRRKLWCS